MDGFGHFILKIRSELLLLRPAERERRVGVLRCGRRHGRPQQQLHPRALILRLPAARRRGLPHVLAARGPELVSRGGGSGEPDPGEV